MIGPGDKVVCVRDDWRGTPIAMATPSPKRGEICTVRDWFDHECISLVEYLPIDGFLASHFRKLDISQFRDMAKNADTLPVTERKEVTA